MTRQESFKKRVRARVLRTGERYTAARQALLDKAAANDRRVWASEPEMGDDAVRAATGRGWDEWCDIIDEWPGRDDGHTAIADHLRSAHGVDMWWSQSVTGGYERITGRRVPYERPDGTFTAGKSRTVTVNAADLRRMLLDDDQRRHLFPGVNTELRSKPTSKAVRIAIGPGVALLGLRPTDGEDRVKVTVQHQKLPDIDQVDKWRFYWSEWLEAIDGSDSA